MEYTKKTEDKEEKGTAQRTRIAFTPIEMDKFEEKYIDMLLSRYWTKEWLDGCQSTMQRISG